MKSVVFSIRSKGLRKYLTRGQSILKRYGLTPSKMMQALDQLSRVLRDFECGATFPITAVTVRRNSEAAEMLRKYVDQGIEFAIHGYRHVDHSQLTLEEQVVELRRAREVFAAAGIPVAGFRSPYLRFNESLRTAAGEIGLAYVSNQSILWDVLDGKTFPSAAQAAYIRALALYTPWSAEEWPSVPYLQDGMVEIPVSLPDDEMLLDRLGGDDTGLVERAWSRILGETYRRGELFTLQLHPERAVLCASALSALLAKARSLDPPAWVARMEEIASWWRALSEASVTVTGAGDGKLCLSVAGPERATLLIRNLEVDGPAHSWIQGYQRCATKTLVVRTDIRPFVGVSPDISPEWLRFLQQQGYIVEISDDLQGYSIYLNRHDFVAGNRRAPLIKIEESDDPLVKLGRWPDGARSALAVTGDIDALTVWDYGLRYLGH